MSWKAKFHLPPLALCLIVVALLGPVAAAAQDVRVNYNRAKDFSQYHTYAWGEKPNPNKVKNPSIAHEVYEQINLQLQKRGLKLVPESQSPDLVLVVSGGSKEQTTYSDYDPSGTILTAGTDLGEAETTTVGALVVDIYDVKAKQVVWRATATGILSKNNSKNLELVDSAVEKMFKKYPYPLALD
ncbi:MAG TPA: DUF4136 domain-containing protein [Terriglobales bacterium]|nr:DUF4136 domain-containing protein [Terriglobales bacterium]